jgi:uncharacterized membrane protein YgcG
MDRPADPHEPAVGNPMTALDRSRAGGQGRSLVAFAAAGLLALATFLAFAGPAVGAEPRNLAGQLTDDVAALTAAEEQEVLAAFERLQDDTGVQLWAWYTATTGDLTAPEFAAETADRSSLGGTDLLLVIALDDRAYGYSRPDAFPLSDADLELLLSRELEPALRDEDYAAALIDVAAALGVALAAPAETSAPATQAPGTAEPAPQPSDGVGIGTILAVIVVVGLIAGVGWFLLVKRRHGAALGVGSGGSAPVPGGGDPLSSLSDDDLNAEANRVLLATDDAIRDSEQELGFAEAQFGDAAAAPFREAIAAAREDLKAAFAVRQKLDDSTAEDRPTRRRMLGELIGHCRQAQGRLDAEAARFEELRAFEREAPKVLAGLPAAADAAEARLPAVEATMAHLQEYADASWQAVAPNLDEARARIAAARAAVAEGEQAAASGDGPHLAAAARAGQEAIAQATGFLDAIEHLGAELDQARDRVATEIAEAEADLVRARTASATTPADPGLPGRLAEIEALVAGARRDLDPPKPDVASAYTRARRANEIGDEVLATIRTAAEQRAALASRLETSLRGAQATVTRAADYVATHRGGVKESARTRLAEAERRLDAAVAVGATDPAAGIREAEQAAGLANEALGLAQRDYDGWDDPWRGGGRRGGGGEGDGDVAAAVIGLIIGGMLAGGGRGGGGFPSGGVRRGGGGGGWGGGGSIGRSGGGGRSSGGGRW